jgi:hypothetical protein
MAIANTHQPLWNITAWCSAELNLLPKRDSLRPIVPLQRITADAGPGRSLLTRPAGTLVRSLPEETIGG